LPVYVIYPQGVQTGGPEACHQLVHAIRNLGEEAFLVPTPETSRAERVPAYEVYDCPVVATIPHGSKTVVVASEYHTHLLHRKCECRNAIWWLSVDNYRYFGHLRHAAMQERTGTYLVRNELRRARNFFARKWQFRNWRRAGYAHFCQSEYARSVVASEFGESVQMLTDYLGADVLRGRPNTDLRLSRVAYNPKKVSGQFIARVSNIMDESAEFVGLRDLKPQEVPKVLSSCAIYLDLGYHPGRDRMPREAAMCNAIVIVGMRGSAANDIDVPIPREFKVTDSEDAHAAASLIQHIVSSPGAAFSAMTDYRAAIANQREEFFAEVSALLEWAK
jgi:hypothetical protein